jgi:hypothetical protein
MRNDWIMDVLADLRSFAASNDLPLLAEQLDDTALVAVAELNARNERSAKQEHGRNNEPIRLHSVGLGTGRVS